MKRINFKGLGFTPAGGMMGTSFLSGQLAVRNLKHKLNFIALWHEEKWKIYNLNFLGTGVQPGRALYQEAEEYLRTVAHPDQLIASLKGD